MVIFTKTRIMLIGHYFTKLTTKGRTALPKIFRKQIGNTAIAARWYEGCLVIVGEKQWGELLDKLTAKAAVITQSVRDTDRFILGSAFEIKFDSQGRFVIPRALREYAGLREEAVFMGLGDRVEVWDRQNWEDREELIQKHASSLVEKLANKGS